MAKQAKLSAQQRKLLEAAASRADGAAIVPARLPKSSATKLAAALEGRKLLRPVQSKSDMPIWRKDVSGKSITLVLTAAGRTAIGVAAGKARARINKTPAPKSGEVSDEIKAPRAGSKLALVIEMLSAEQGATLAALAKATSWLPHTTRATLTGLRKKGFDVERFNVEASGLSAYRLVSAATAVKP